MMPSRLGEGEDRESRGAVLIVDDEALIRLVFAETLRDAGFTVIEAASGDEAIQLLTAGVDVDALVTDVRMPGDIDGLALAAAARNLRPDLPIAISSAHLPSNGTILPDIVSTVLVKPYLPERLVNVVEKMVLEKR